jgi:anti-sigma factor RsiW
MSHLTDEQLSALADGALEGAARAAAERHLGACDACRQKLAGFVAQDGALRAALEHDPGEAYFETFAARVGGRLRAAGLGGAQARAQTEGRSLADWFRSPRKLALLGAVAAVVAGAGIVMLTTREARMPALREREIEARAEQEAPAGRAAAPAPPIAPVPVPTAGTEDKAVVRAPETPTPETRETSPRGGAGRGVGSGAPLNRAYEVRRDASGEDVPVRKPGGFVYRPPERALAPAPPGAIVRAPKQRYAVPLESEKKGGVPRGGAQPAPADEEAPATPVTDVSPGSLRPALPVRAGTAGAPQAERSSLLREGLPGPGRICGEVIDDAGRPIAGAQVVNRSSGASVRTAADGSFCLEAGGRSQEIAVMAVGFEPRWQTVAAEERARVVLRAVPVLSTQGETAARAGVRDARIVGGKGQPRLSGGAPSASFDRWDTFTRIRGKNAQRLSALAEQVGTPSAWDSAAMEWQRVLEAVAGGPLESRVRYEIARARVLGWRADRTEIRAATARAALDAFLVQAPAGAERDAARGWLGQLKR